MSHFGHERHVGAKIFHILVAIDQRALCDIGICPIHKRHGIAEALVARRRIEHHAVELARIARNGAREAVARIVGRSGFHAANAVVHAHELIGGLQRNIARRAVGRRDRYRRRTRVNDAAERVVLHGVRHERRNVACARMQVFIAERIEIEAMGVRVHRMGHAQIGGLRVHRGDKRIVARRCVARHMGANRLRDGNARIVARRNHERVQGRLERHGVAFQKPRA